MAFYTESGSIRTENGDIVALTGKVVGQQFLVNGAATWTAGAGEPTPQSCSGSGFGSLHSRTDAPDSGHALYVCTPQGWVAK
jgi:hypothetical protein